MSDFADSYSDLLAVDCDNGNMLFACSISCVGDEFFERTSLAFRFEKFGYSRKTP